MLDQSLALYVRVLTHLTRDDREAGQGTLEYVGIVIIAGILVLAVIAGLGGGGDITKAISDGIKKVTGAGA